MSTLMALSRVAARTTLTSQVLSEWPDRAASSSARALTDSGIRSVIRASAALLLDLLRRRGSRRRGGERARSAGAVVDDEVELAAVEADVDAAGRHLGGDLGGGLGDRLHQRQPGRRVRARSASRSAACVISGPPASAAATRSRRRLSTYGVMSMCTTMTSSVTSCQALVMSCRVSDVTDVSVHARCGYGRGHRMASGTEECMPWLHRAAHGHGRHPHRRESGRLPDPRDLLRLRARASASWPAATSRTRSTSSSPAARCPRG